MKQIPWDFFAQRRNISYSSFKNMSYDQYKNWCARRNIIPLDETVFESKVGTPPPVKTTTIQPKEKPKDTKSLLKHKKNELIELCNGLGIELSGKETKKQLVSLLTAEQ